MKQKAVFVFATTMAVIAALSGAPGNIRPAHAAGILVDTTVDEAVTDGKCSLREAIDLFDGFPDNADCGATKFAGPISFQSGIGMVNIDTLNKGFIDVNLSNDSGTNVGEGNCAPLVIDGSTGGASGVTIDGGAQPTNTSSMFKMDDSISTPCSGNLFSVVTFNDITFQHGETTGAGGVFTINNDVHVDFLNDHFSQNAANGSLGGAIDAGGATISIKNSVFDSNTAIQEGGAIWSGGTDLLTLEADSFTNNTATESGGAIYNTGTLTFPANPSAISTFSTNKALNTGDSSDGGGGAIFNAGTMTVYATTFTLNAAGDAINNKQGYGGAIAVQSVGLLSDIYDSSFSQNTATTHGSAIYTETAANIVRDTVNANGNLAQPSEAVYVKASNTDQVVIANSTFSNNNASTGSTIDNSDGALYLLNDTLSGNAGGVKDAGTGTTDAANTIFDLNTGSNCIGTITATGIKMLQPNNLTLNLGHNLDDGNSCAFPTANNLTSTPAQLAALAPVGGYPFQQGFIPATGSPAIGGGDKTVCTLDPWVKNLDQRGAAAFPTFTRPNPQNCTIGALEVPLAASTIGKGFNPTSIASGGTSTITFTLTNANFLKLTNASLPIP